MVNGDANADTALMICEHSKTDQAGPLNTRSVGIEMIGYSNRWSAEGLSNLDQNSNSDKHPRFMQKSYASARLQQVANMISDIANRWDIPLTSETVPALGGAGNTHQRGVIAHSQTSDFDPGCFSGNSKINPCSGHSHWDVGTWCGSPVPSDINEALIPDDSKYWTESCTEVRDYCFPWDILQGFLDIGARGDSENHCAENEITDCNGDCQPVERLMQDDSCDEVFNCEQWGHDYYDCLGQDTRNCGDNPSCHCGTDGDVPDADGDCCSPLLIGNGSCDNASDACNMTEYSNDGGDCDSGGHGAFDPSAILLALALGLLALWQRRLRARLY